MLLKLLERLPSRVDGSAFVLAPDDLSSIEETSVIEGISVTRRSMLQSFGTLDFLIVRVTRRSASLLGLWLASTFLSRSRAVHRLQLGADSHGVRFLAHETRTPADQTAMLPAHFVWNPSEIGTFLRHQQRTPERELPRYFMTDAEGSWSEPDLDRDTLWVSGEGRAVAFLAEFFLNFGLADCDFNYETLRDTCGFSFGTPSSSGMRVEIER